MKVEAYSLQELNATDATLSLLDYLENQKKLIPQHRHQKEISNLYFCCLWFLNLKDFFLCKKLPTLSSLRHLKDFSRSFKFKNLQNVICKNLTETVKTFFNMFFFFYYLNVTIFIQMFEQMFAKNDLYKVDLNPRNPRDYN